MNSTLLALALTWTAAAPVPVVERVAPPKGPPPAHAIAVFKDGKLRVQRTTLVPVTWYEQQTRTVVRDGRPITQKIVVPVTRNQVQQQIKWVDRPKAYDTAGKEIDALRLAELLKRETAVLISGDGKPLDPFYLDTIKDGTLILVVDRVGPLAGDVLPAPSGVDPSRPPR